jgi:hypothetical protein
MLYHYYLKENKVPEFTGYLEKQEEHWDAFLEYKESDLAKKRSATNKLNASNKIYHHHLGTGGYRTAMPKWDKAEAEMHAAGMTPATEGWPLRATNWILSHGSSYDPQTGQLIHNNKIIIVPHIQLLEAIKEVEEGKFKPGRENDELTKALKNKEHPGRTRGFGPDVPWILGFPEDEETYKSRARSKNRELERLQKLETSNLELYDMIKDLQQQVTHKGSTIELQQDTGFDTTADPSQKKSSMASTGALGDDAHVDEAPIDRYPVGDIMENKNCELHQSMYP